MSESDRLMRAMSVAALGQLRTAYEKALLAQVRGEDAQDDWDAFRRVMVRSLVLGNLCGRLAVVNRIRTPVPEEDPFSRKELAEYRETSELITRPFYAALNLFMNRVPQLRRVVAGLMPVAVNKAFWVTGVESQKALTDIQTQIGETLKGKGMGVGAFVKQDAVLGLSKARLETVYRTNVISALASGSQAQIHDPTTKPSVAVIQLREIQDNRTRGNPSGLYPDAGPHYQMDGFIESPDNPVWSIITPSNGYNCRARIAPVPWIIAERAGWANDGGLVQSAIDRHNGRRWSYIRSGEYPDKSFRGPKSFAI